MALLRLQECLVAWTTFSLGSEYISFSPTSSFSLSFIISSLLLVVIMFCHTMFVHAILILAAITHVASASHIHRYHRYHRDALNNPALQRRDETKPRPLDLDILAKYICTPCSSASKRDEPDALFIPLNDLPTHYSELQTLRSQKTNHMAAVGLPPSKHSRFASSLVAQFQML